jgi:predicted ATPase/class 3 adenylate cyclase
MTQANAMGQTTAAQSEPLPAGTVTFMLTDIEGSTQMWRQNPQEMFTAVARHQELIHQNIRRFGGGLPRDQGEGDSVFAAFPRATKAVAAALAIQRALAEEPWPEGTFLRVRVGLHTGEAELRDGNYYGFAVGRTSRIRALASGGQTLLSHAVYELVRDRLPDGASVRDLGAHPIKDFEDEERIFQLCHPDLPGEFPPLQVREAKPHNLPLMLTTFVGRETEIRELKELLASARLVTLTGAGGSGKTRLAIEAAKEVLDEFEDGVHFVDLASLKDPHLVLPTITQSLGIHENPGQSTFDTLAVALQEKHMLLLLDSFERVIPSAPTLAQLLGECPQLTVMATSRANLELRGEYEFSVPPLTLPSSEQIAPLGKLQESEAVKLFCERAKAASFDFALTPDNAPAIVEICTRLDGLPLAIELAAVRMRTLPLRVLLDRLSSRLDILTGGARDLPARQQTLRSLIDWDYEMLDEREQALFRCLAVCAGGFTLDAAAAVAGLSDGEALSGVESLMAKSLLRHGTSGGDPRFVMLQTVRDYAIEVLAESGELDDARRRHATFYLALAEEGSSELSGPNQVEWLRALELEHDNMRAALEWTHEQDDPELELRLVGALSWFWITRGHLSEGRGWIEAAIKRSSGRPSLRRADVLRAAATYARARRDTREAKRLLDEYVELQRSLGDDAGMAMALKDLGNVRSDEGDVTGARELYEQSLQLWEKTGDREGIAATLNNLGYMASLQGDIDGATKAFAKCIELFREIGDKQGVARGLMNQGAALREKGRLVEAAETLRASLGLWTELGDQWDVSDCLDDLAAVYVKQEDFSVAATLYGGAEAIREAIGAQRPPMEETTYSGWLETTRAGLGDAEFKQAFDDGFGMDMEQITDYALGLSE